MTKPLGEFNARADSKDGHRNDCKECRKARDRVNWDMRMTTRYSMVKCVSCCKNRRKEFILDNGVCKTCNSKDMAPKDDARCTRCGVMKAWDNFYYSSGVLKFPWCKSCRVDYENECEYLTKEYFSRNATKHRRMRGIGPKMPAMTHEEKLARNRQWARSHPEYCLRVRHKRMAMEKAAWDEDVDIAVLYARDGGICQLCLETVDYELRGRHPMQKSIDHIIPISRGGRHGYANTQLAHLECNIKKGNRMPGVMYDNK
jgi:5-methylcytosine-specific restriction endonuclease McrA